MNLIEAWKTNPEAKLYSASRRLDINLACYTDISHLMRNYHNDSILADDWEIVKAPKKVVIDTYNPPESLINTLKQAGRIFPPTGICVKHTLEWEE